MLLNFYSNQEYIAANLCEQKEEIENCCQGSCHLTKELSKTDEKIEDSRIPGEKNQKRELTEEMPLFLSKLFRLKKPLEINTSINAAPVTKTCSGFKSNITHPPPLTN